MNLIDISRELARETGALSFAPPVTHVYNPLDYARAPHEEYLERYGSGQPDTILLGMNPGPFGMAQTGVPFGEVEMVKDWLGIVEPVDRPQPEHPRRPVEGFACTRSEVSGARLWGWARETFATPGRFFAKFLVMNYCPLCFMEESGRNRTPDKLPVAEREPLFRACDKALRNSIQVLRPRRVVGIGAFANKRARAALAGMDVTLGQILHPSPASPAANRGWAQQANRQLTELGAL
jgi:single-strand selective monofunctional uracil DNA glycosylase